MRRSWASLSPYDQGLYKNALALAMNSGAYAKFVEVHTEMMSTTEAHKSCMFIYWHRLFLVVFENMLRAMGSAYACITVPYWDWISDYNRFVNRECTDMLSCSSALQGLGSVSGQQVYLKVNGVQTMGYCTSTYPLDHFCHTTDVKGTQCVRCVTRGPWSSKYLPGSTSYASVRNQLFSANNIYDMSTAIENGAHNNIHAALDGAMATFASPADPIFWSHHAMVDLLHTIFHKCRVGEQQMTFAQKVASPGWNSCKRQNGTAFSPYDSVVMRTGIYGTNPMSGASDPLIGRFFSGVPRQFAALMDHNDLGSSSYVYLYQGLLGEMYYKCGSSATDASNVVTRNLAADPPSKAPAPAASSTVAQAPTAAPVSSTSSPVSETTAVQEVSRHRRLDNSTIDNTEGDLSSLMTIVAAVNTTLDAASQKVSTFTKRTDAFLEAQLGEDVDQIDEQEKMVCMFQNECLGGVLDYSEEFKRTFRTCGKPRCKQIVDDIRSGNDTIGLANWKEKMMETFGCPIPTAVEPPIF
ncbi:hypothetical protein Gpo141_00010008 [Globisporangium polare]